MVFLVGLQSGYVLKELAQLRRVTLPFRLHTCGMYLAPGLLRFEHEELICSTFPLTCFNFPVYEKHSTAEAYTSLSPVKKKRFGILSQQTISEPISFFALCYLSALIIPSLPSGRSSERFSIPQQQYIVIPQRYAADLWIPWMMVKLERERKHELYEYTGTVRESLNIKKAKLYINENTDWSLQAQYIGVKLPSLPLIL